MIKLTASHFNITPALTEKLQAIIHKGQEHEETAGNTTYGTRTCEKVITD
jgi:hypothetical protein